MSSENWSMTPPASPHGIHQDMEAEQDLPLPDFNEQLHTEDNFIFNCNNNGSGFVQLQRLLSGQGDNKWAELPPLVELFNMNFSRDRALDVDIQKLFYLLKQNIGIVQSTQQNSGRFIQQETACVKDSKECRTEVVQFLQYIQDYLRWQDESFLHTEFLQRLTSQLHSTLCYIGRLSESFSCISYSNSGHHGREELVNPIHLDIIWNIIKNLHVIQTRFKDWVYTGSLCMTSDPVSECHPFTQVLQVVLWDLVSVANHQFNTKVSTGDYTQVSMFPCGCMKEMWTLLVYLVESRTQTLSGESFWVSLHHVIQSISSHDSGSSPASESDMEIDSTTIVNPPEMTVKDGTSLCLWILQQVAPLYKDQRLVSNQSHRIVTSNYHDLLSLMKKYLNSTDVSEGTLRQHLRCCCLLSLQWESNTGLLIQLWDYFFRRMNNTFQLNPNSVEGLGSISESALGLFNQCHKWTACSNNGMERENSFKLFQRLLCLHLSHLEWKQMKGRFYSKIHHRRMQELTEGGLYNLTSLFVTLALTTDLEDVASKLCYFYDMLDHSKMTYARRRVVWKGAFTLMLVYEDKQIDIGHLGNRMVAAFDSCVEEFVSATHDTRHNLWKLILAYVEGLQDVCEMSKSMDLSENKLVCSGFKSLLPTCRDAELRCVLSALLSVISKFRQVCSSGDLQLSDRGTSRQAQHTAMADAIWINIYPFIKDHSVTLTPLTLLADLAADLCLMALTYSPRNSLGTKEDFVSVFQMFAMGETINASISCRFLAHLLSSDQVIAALIEMVPSYQAILIRAWFRCCLLEPGPSDQLQEISRCVLQLDEVKEIFTLAQMTATDNLDKAVVMVMKALDKAFSNVGSWKQQMEFKERVMNYFMDVRKHCAVIIRNQSPSESFLNIYRVTGYLVKYCSPLIYVQSKPDCPLPALINMLILPQHVYNTEKPLTPVLSSAIRNTLHLYLQGLGKLDFTKDAYVQRILKEILKIYLPKFNQKGQSGSMSTATATSVHPIVASLSPSFTRQASQEVVKYRHFILHHVVNTYLIATNWTLSSSHSLGLSFTGDVLNRTTSLEIKARDCPILLPGVLDCLLFTDAAGPSHQAALTILQDLMEGYAVNMDLVHKSDVIDILQTFIKTNFKVKQNGVFRVLEKLAMLMCDVVKEIVSYLTEAVKQLEKKRGVGVDTKMRQTYFTLLKMLGPKGEEEILKLNQ